MEDPGELDRLDGRPLRQRHGDLPQRRPRLRPLDRHRLRPGRLQHLHHLPPQGDHHDEAERPPDVQGEPARGRADGLFYLRAALPVPAAADNAELRLLPDLPDAEAEAGAARAAEEHQQHQQRTRGQQRPEEELRAQAQR